MIRRVSGGGAVFLIVALLLTTVAWAGTYRSPDRDATCLVAGNCVDEQGIYISSQSEGDACAPEWLGVISWDLRAASGEWQSASLRLSAYEHSNNGPYTFTIYPATTESWQENGISPDYDSDTALASTTDDLADNELTFASDDLGVYFRNKIGGDATIVIAMTGGCDAGKAFARFQDREGSSARAISEPDLIFWTGHVVNGTPTSATAIQIASFETADAGGVNWLALGIAALLGLIGVGYGIRRLRA